MKRVPPLLYVLGVLLVILGIAALISGYGKGVNEQGRDMTAITMGSVMFSFGMMVIAGGFYLAAANIDLGPQGTVTLPRAETVSARKFKVGNCAICKNNPALMRCMTHMVPLCASCMAKHDNGTNCEYIPMARKASKPASGPRWG